MSSLQYFSQQFPDFERIGLLRPTIKGNGWMFFERCYFSLLQFFCTADPFRSTILCQLWREFLLGGKVTWMWREFEDEKVHRKAQYQFSQVSGLISVWLENSLFGDVLEYTKQTKGENTTTPDRWIIRLSKKMLLNLVYTPCLYSCDFIVVVTIYNKVHNHSRVGGT